MSEPAWRGTLGAGIAAAAQRWSLPEVEGPVVGRPRPPDRDAEERAAQAARQAGHERGYQEGMAAANTAMQPRIEQLQTQIRHMDEILTFLAQPLQQLDAEVEQQLARLALTVARQLLRRELKADPAQVIGIIREAVARLPAAAREVRVHLHPEDAAVVNERLAAPATERAWSIVEDPALTRGGCVVRSENSQIDARFESRLNAIVSGVLGDERGGERGA